MRLLFACHRYHPVPGGSERMIQTLAENLVRRGHEATVLTQREPGVPHEEELHGVHVVRLPMRRVGGIRVPSGYLRFLRNSPADLFHLTGNRIWCADFYFPFARLFRWPQVVTGHGFYQYAIHRTQVDRLYFERYLPWALRGVDRYVCDTEYERGQLLSWGMPAAKLTKIPPGIPLEEFARSPIPPALLRAQWRVTAPWIAVYAGGFFENKRVDRLVEALAGTRGRWALIALGRDLPGTPYDRDHCLARAKALGVEMVAPGPVDRPEAVASLFAGDAVVSASDYEGFGILFAEALAVGRPLVAWATGAAPEIAEAGGGFCVRSVPEMTAALTRLEDGELRRTVGERSVRAAPGWSIDSVTDRHLELYRAILSERSEIK